MLYGLFFVTGTGMPRTFSVLDLVGARSCSTLAGA